MFDQCRPVDAAASAAGPVFGPPVALAAGPLGAVQAADREIARQMALRTKALVAFAATRPVAADRAQGEPGAMSAARWAARSEALRPVSEWAAPEVALALSRTQPGAERLLDQALTLVQKLPGVLAALEAGALTEGQLWPLLDLLAPVADDALRAEIEAELLGWLAERAANRTITTPPQLRAKLRRVLLQRGARDAADKALRAVRDRGIYLHGTGGEGLGALCAVATDPEIRVLHAALGAYADAVEDEPGAEPRTRAQKMLDCLLDLVLRPGESGHPPVRVVLTVVAAVQTLLGGDAPAEVNGTVVSAETARRLLSLLTGVDLGAAALAEYAAAAAAADHEPAAGTGDAPTGDAATGEDDSVAAARPAAVTGDDATDAPDATVGVAVSHAAGSDDAAAPAAPGGDGVAVPEEWAWADLDLDEDELVALAEWWAETERRILAGELDPGPVPEEIRAAWAADPDGLCGPAWLPGEPAWLSDPGSLLDRDDLADPDDPYQAAELLAADPPEPGSPPAGEATAPPDDVPPEPGAVPVGEAIASPDGIPPEPGAVPVGGETAPPEDAPPEGVAPEGGWWAAADRAVEDAARAQHAALLALGHAQCTVRTAEVAAAADEQAWRASPGGRVDAARDAIAALAVAAAADRRRLAELLRRGAGGGLADRPRLALVGALSGALVALTDLPGLRRAAHCGAPACRRRPESCTHDLTGRPGLGAPGPSDGYRPSAALDRFLRARDRRCRFPGCRRPVATGELDHRVRYPDGPTDATNLAGFCVGNHRGKHQAPGWRYDLAPDGTLIVTTPSRLTATSAPPPY